MEQSIKEWYVSTYPSDELGVKIADGVTFWTLFDALDAYQDVYAVLSVGDSIIRERCFERLSVLIDMPYSYVYEQWMRAVS